MFSHMVRKVEPSSRGVFKNCHTRSSAINISVFKTTQPILSLHYKHLHWQYLNEWLDLTEGREQEVPVCAESNEEGENPLDSYRLNSEETMLISQVPTSEEISISPGEEKKPSQ